MNHLSVYKHFGYTENQHPEIKQCVNFYAKKVTLSNFFPKLWDRIKAIFQASAFHETKRILATQAEGALKNFFGKDLTVDSALQNRVTDFVLRHAITQKSLSKNQNQYFIDQNRWVKENMASMSPDEVFIRATFSENEITRGFTPRTKIIALVNRVSNIFNENVERVQSYLASPAIQAAEKYLNYRKAALSHAQGDENPLDHLKSITNIAQNTVETFQQIMDPANVPNLSLQNLLELYKDVKKESSLFQEVSSSLLKCVQGR